MKLLFWRNKKQTAKLDDIEREATLAHKKSVNKIVDTRRQVDRLNKALKENNIVFELAHVVGQAHK